eukprot:scaffold36015_cov18-Tisochrysis_lutea.AAC.1
MPVTGMKQLPGLSPAVEPLTPPLMEPQLYNMASPAGPHPHQQQTQMQDRHQEAFADIPGQAVSQQGGSVFQIGSPPTGSGQRADAFEGAGIMGGSFNRGMLASWEAAPTGKPRHQDESLEMDSGKTDRGSRHILGGKSTQRRKWKNHVGSENFPTSV